MNTQEAYPATYVLIGAGWRAEFFAHLAQMAPHKLRVAGWYVRNSAKAAQLQASWGIRITSSLDEALQAPHEFVIPCVSWPAMPVMIKELIQRGERVLAETPPAPTIEELEKLWEDVGSESGVQVAEQYTRMPGHAARLRAVHSGIIGDTHQVQIASTHLYHATSLIRAFLGVGFDECTVTGRTLPLRIMDPLSPVGPAKNPSIASRNAILATLDFGEARTGIYDFVDNQWWNPLLSRRIIVRGTLGELVDNHMLHWKAGHPVASRLEYRRTGVDLNLEGNALDHISLHGEIMFQNEWAGSRMSEDDIAVAEILRDMSSWVRGEGPEPYPLREAIHDHALGLAIEESARTGNDITVAGYAWQK